VADKDVETDVLLKEVDEELKKERYAELWKAYGNYVIGAALVLVVATGGWQFWTGYQKEQREQAGESFARAAALAEAGNADQAAAAFTELAEDAGAGYATLSRFRAAGLAARRGDMEGAIALFNEVAADSSVDRLYRDLATLLAALHGVDVLPDERLLAQIEPLTDDANPWRYSALELKALLAERSGDTDRAREIFTRLGDDEGAPAGLRSRARQMLVHLEGS